MLIDYVTLRVIWWVLLGALLIGFAITDGFDLGIGMILHRVAKTPKERDSALGSIEAIWEGNQIWLILGAGAIFAAWPEIYAVTFSGFYFAMLAVLFSLILRPVGFKYRNKIKNPIWRSAWELGIFIAGFVPALVFGVAVGNVLQGVPFYYDAQLQSYYTGSLIGLLNPFALLCGFISVFMLIMHGGIFLSLKNEGDVQKRASRYAIFSACITIILFVLAGFWIAHMNGYVVASPLLESAPSNPLHKKVMLMMGAWLSNYHRESWTLAAPLLGIAGAFFATLFIFMRFFKCAFLASAVSIAGIISTVGVSMFPFILPSITHPEMSLLVWDASSSQLTLLIMLFATVIFLPIIIIYTSWVYYVLRGKNNAGSY